MIEARSGSTWFILGLVTSALIVSCGGSAAGPNGGAAASPSGDAGDDTTAGGSAGSGSGSGGSLGLAGSGGSDGLGDAGSAGATELAGSGGTSGHAGSTGHAGSGGTSGHAGSAGHAGSGGTSGHAGSSGASGHAGNGGGPAASSTLGAACLSTAQCDSGMVCLTPDSSELNGGGPANGMCTLACTSSADCIAVSAGADCFNFGTTAAPKLYCLDGCTQGGTDAATVATKCQGRADFACVDLSSSSVPDPFCIPLCRSDLECGTGLYCNKGSGLCSKTKPTGDPVGTPCSPDAATATCAGFCIRTSADNVKPVTGVCAEYCSGLLDCMYDGDKPGGLCAGQFSDTFGILDLGYCEPSCECTGQCPFPDDQCRAWNASEQSLAQDLGKPGLCYPNVTDSTELTICTN